MDWGDDEQLDEGFAEVEVEQTVCSFFHASTRDSGTEVGVAVLSRRNREEKEDQKDRQLQLFQFHECDQFSNLESLLVQINPQRCVHEELDSKANLASGFKRKVENLMLSVNVKGQDVKKTTFTKENIEQDLLSLTGSDSLSIYQDALDNKPLAVRALGALIRSEDLLGDDRLVGRFELEVGQLERYMRLDAAAVDALNLFPSTDHANQAQAREASLLGVLDHCKTKGLGTKLLSQWIRQPLLDHKEITWRQDLVGAFKDDNQRRQSIQDVLRGVPDLTKVLRKFESGRAGLKEMYQLYLFIQLLPRLSGALSNVDEGELNATQDMQEMARQCDAMCGENRFAKFSELVESVLDLDLAPAEFRVKPVHDETGKLAQLANELEKISARRDRVRQELEDGPLSNFNARFELDPGMQKTYGYHFRVLKKHDVDLKKIKAGNYLNVVSACIRWGTTQLKDLYDEYMSTFQEIQSKQRVIVQQAAEVALTFIPLFEGIVTLISKVDVLTSLAHAAAYAGSDGYVRPQLVPIGSPSREIHLERARHPCLEMLDSVDFIPNDYTFDDKSKLQIITGPNMGGKSVYCRTLGTILVMAQIGSFVPCDSAQLPIVDAVLARVGAGDAQLRGVSTFMAEMIEASAIVSTATENSLIILDELGRGTSTYDGFGLAWAIGEHLAKHIKPFCLFATHFHELTGLSNHVEGVKNKHVSALATDSTITMLYTVNDGACEKSFGINIAKMAGFPDDVVASAKRKADQLESLTVIDSSSTEQQKDKRARVDQALALVRQLALLPKDKATDIAYLKSNLLST